MRRTCSETSYILSGAVTTIGNDKNIPTLRRRCVRCARQSTGLEAGRGKDPRVLRERARARRGTVTRVLSTIYGFR